MNDEKLKQLIKTYIVAIFAVFFALLPIILNTPFIRTVSVDLLIIIWLLSWIMVQNIK